MARRRYLVMYDIRDELRLRRVHDVVKGYGDRLQYSVYVCDLSPTELTNLKWEVGDEINALEDAVAILDLGDPERPGSTRFDFLGVRPQLPSSGATVV